MPSRIASRTYGSVSPDKQSEMTGLEFVQGLADRTLPLNTMARPNFGGLCRQVVDLARRSGGVLPTSAA